MHSFIALFSPQFKCLVLLANLHFSPTIQYIRMLRIMWLSQTGKKESEETIVILSTRL